jgi:hypothetical protein
MGPIRNSVFIIIAFASCAYAQADTPGIQRLRLEKLSHLIVLKVTQSTDVEKLAVITGARDIRLSPNAASITGLSFSYRYIYFGISTVLRFLPGNNDDIKKGRTRNTGLVFSLGGKHWYNEFTYAKTRGYYLTNTRDFNTNWTSGQPYVQIPALVLTQFQGITAYNFNMQYSLSAVTFQTERQLRSAGSFIPRIRYGYFINDDQSIPLPNGFTQKARNLEIIAGPGYHYTFVARERFYASLALTPGVGYLYSRIATRYATETMKGNQHNLVWRLDSRAGAGYNGGRFFAGLYADLGLSAFNQQHTRVNTEDDRTAWQLFVGYRLRAPRWIAKPVQKAGKIIGID